MSIPYLHPFSSQSLLKRGPLMRLFGAWLSNASISMTANWMTLAASLLTCMTEIRSQWIMILILLLLVEFWKN